MGQATNQIATEAEAKTIGGSTGSVTTNLCVIKSRATALGCSVSGSYADNQLVMFSDLSKAWTRPTTLKIYYGLGSGTTGWTAQIKLANNSWKTLSSSVSTSSLYSFGTNVVYTTSLQNCKYGSNGKYTYPSYITIEYKYKLASDSPTLGKYKLWREVIAADSTSDTYASVFNGRLKVFDNTGIPEGTENLEANATIYAYIYPGENH